MRKYNLTKNDLIWVNYSFQKIWKEIQSDLIFHIQWDKFDIKEINYYLSYMQLN